LGLYPQLSPEGEREKKTSPPPEREKKVRSGKRERRGTISLFPPKEERREKGSSALVLGRKKRDKTWKKRAGSRVAFAKKKGKLAFWVVELRRKGENQFERDGGEKKGKGETLLPGASER